MWIRKSLIFFLLVFATGCVSRQPHVLNEPSNLTISKPVIINKNNKDYICISCIAKQVHWDNLLMSASFELRGHNVKIILGSPWVKIDNFHIKLPKVVVLMNGKIYADKSILSYLRNFNIINSMNELKVVIDPGHGGKDPGAMANGIKEKDIVLDIARRLAVLLKRSGVKVYMTRNSDVYVSLKSRSKFTNKILPNVFISIHANASRNHYAKGIEVYYISKHINDTNRAVVSKENSVLRFDSKSEPNPKLTTILWDMIYTENRAESLRLAKNISKDISLIMNSPNRGAKGAPFYVLKWVNVPAVLIEVGFVSNKSEARKLANPNYREKIASAIFKGLVSYFEEIKRDLKN